MKLNPETQQRIADMHAKSQFASEDELVNKALDALDELQAAKQDFLAKIDEGLAELDRGEGIPAEEVFAELRAMHAKRTTKPRG